MSNRLTGAPECQVAAPSHGPHRADGLDAEILAVEQERQALIAEAESNSVERDRQLETLPEQFRAFGGVVVSRRWRSKQAPMEMRAVTVEDIEAQVAKLHPGGITPDVRRRREALIIKLERARAVYQNARSDIGPKCDALDEANRELYERIFGLEQQIIRTPAHTLTSVKIKLMIEAEALGIEGAAVAADETLELDEADESEAVLLCVLRDIARIQATA